MECGRCPLALPCYARRLFEENSHGMLCPKCGRFTHVRFRTYKGVHTAPNGSRITIDLSAANLGLPPEARAQMEQYHTVIRCPERQLSIDALEHYEKLAKEALFIPPTVPDPLEYCGRILVNPTTVNFVGDVYLNVVPCAICERERYSKAALIECLD